jgi:hypothetical protein
MPNGEKDKSQEAKYGYLKRLWNDAKASTDTAKFWIEVIALAVLCLYTYYANQQASAALTANRPYVGVETVKARYTYPGVGDSSKQPTSPTEKPIGLVFEAQIKNFGPVPGTNFKTDGKPYFNGEPFPNIEIPSKPSTLFPTQIVFVTGVIMGDRFKALQQQQATLLFDVTIEYNGPGGHYKECTEYRYSPELQGFFDLGPCTR